MRVCRVCKTEFPFESFLHRVNDACRGVCAGCKKCTHTICKKCEASRSKEYRKTHKEQVSRTQKNWYTANKEQYLEGRWAYNKRQRKNNPEKWMWVTARDRAKRKEQQFDITPEDIRIPLKCPYLGIKLAAAEDKAAENSPSLDRIDNTKGYIATNIEVVSNRANNLKHNGTAEEHLKIGMRMYWMTKEITSLADIGCC